MSSSALDAKINRISNVQEVYAFVYIATIIMKMQIKIKYINTFHILSVSQKYMCIFNEAESIVYSGVAAIFLLKFYFQWNR